MAFRFTPMPARALASLALAFALTSAAFAQAGKPPAVAATSPAVAPANAAPPASSAAPGGSLDGRIQDLKSDVIKLNRDLLVLEEELLFPANTQVALFVSMDVGKLFNLESVQIKLDDKLVTHYLYTPMEVAALHRGGVQRVHIGNLKAGEHEIVAFFTGQGPAHGEQRRDYKRATTVRFDKGTEPRYIELKIKDSTGKLQPEFEVKVW
ncbi:MAG TPA: AraC family transcriptional regulator [Methylibium sp.]|uniref:AraC family transcriptional regulator n=1 Tax=Methylibium sp. TaxID=2067992 RepID=UPI002DBA7DDA|nr:AraC family transcriptional regulator [Methylibium sp.]HEU4459171.1 AraC family transcriptional regulator [Methylibium sp.]